MYLNDYQKLMVEVKEALDFNPFLIEKITGYIDNLEMQKANSQKQYIETFSRLEKTDYELSNLKRDFENVGDTVKLYEKENDAMRGLLRVWI